MSVGKLTGSPASTAPGLAAAAGERNEPGGGAGFGRGGALSLAGVAAAVVAMALVLAFRSGYPRLPRPASGGRGNRGVLE